MFSKFECFLIVSVQKADNNVPEAFRSNFGLIYSNLSITMYLFIFMNYSEKFFTHKTGCFQFLCMVLVVG